MRISWNKGISISYNGLNLTLDTEVKSEESIYALVSHAHYDHSKAFKIKNLRKYSTKETREIAALYSNLDDAWHPLIMNKVMRIGDFEIVPHNSGHVLGSCEIEIATPQGTILYTGDFNTRETYTMKSAEPVPCDVLIIEATFGSPRFQFPSIDEISDEMVKWAEKTIKEGKIPTLQTDPLGNAQEIIKIFNKATESPIVASPSISRINEVYRTYGFKLEYYDSRSEEGKEILVYRDSIYIVPKRYYPRDSRFEVALVSGWALLTNRNGFPLSDHADFKRTIEFIEECNPQLILTCHGGKHNYILAEHIEKRLKIQSYPIQLIPTKIEDKFEEERISSCEKTILNIAKVPGFRYSKRVIIKEAQKCGFTRSEINITLERLEEEGFLERD